MNNRQKRKRIKIGSTAKQRRRNKELCKRYPFLIPRNDWTGEICWVNKKFDNTLADDFPRGWWKAFGLQLCEELREDLIKCNYLNEFRFFQIKEKFGCYDSETEVLTQNGWKYFKNLSFQDKIATLNQNSNCLEYQYPTDIIAEKYIGKMYRLENRGVSLCVTPNHKLYVSKGSYYNGSKNNEKREYPYELVTPDIYFGKDKRFKKGCSWIGEDIYPTFKIKGNEYDSLRKKDDINSGVRHYVCKNKEYDLIPFLRFLGFYIAEGCVTIKGKRACEISIAYNGLDEEELICGILKDIGYDGNCENKNGASAIKRIYDTTLGEWLLKQCGHLAPNKKVPEFIKNLKPEYIEEFLKYLFIGDGHKTLTSNILTTTSKQLSDDVQELLIKCGYSFREYKRTAKRKMDGRSKISMINNTEVISKHDIYEINWLKLTEIEIDNSKAKDTKSFIEEWIDYNGSVYCVEVPNHIIYIRRNGKGIWCGNSLRAYTGSLPQESNASRIIDKYSYLSENICISCGKPDVPMIYDGWYSPYCFDCHRKKYYNIKKPIDQVKVEYDNYICDKQHWMSNTYTVRHYSKDGNWDETIDISETANRIRNNWKGMV